MGTFNRDLGELTEITGFASAGSTRISNRVAANVFDFTFADINDAAAGYPAGQRGNAPGSGLWPTLTGAGCPWDTTTGGDYYVGFSATAKLPPASAVSEVLVSLTQGYNGAPGSGVEFACGSVAVTSGLPAGYDDYMAFTDNALHSVSVPALYKKGQWTSVNSLVTLHWNIKVPQGTAGSGPLTTGVSQMVVTFVKDPLR